MKLAGSLFCLFSLYFPHLSPVLLIIIRFQMSPELIITPCHKASSICGKHIINVDSYNRLIFHNNL